MKIDNVNRSEKIIGPDIGALKGNSTRIKPKPVKYGVVDIPTERIEQHKDLIPFMDTIFLNDMPILTGIYSTIRYRSLVCLDSH